MLLNHLDSHIADPRGSAGCRRPLSSKICLAFNPLLQSCTLYLQVSLEELLALTAALECESEHPLASSVLDFAESVIAPPQSHKESTSATGVRITFAALYCQWN